MIIWRLLLIVALPPPFALLSPVAQPRLSSFCDSGAGWETVRRPGVWLVAHPRLGGAGPTLLPSKGSSLPGEASKHAFLGESEKKKMKAWGFVVSVNHRETPYLLRARASSPGSAALATIILPLLSVEDFVSPPEKWKQLCYSSFPL